MKPNDSGWRSGRRCAASPAGRRAARRRAGRPGPAKSRSPITTSTGHVTVASSLGRERTPRRAAAARRRGRRRSLPGCVGVLAEQPGQVVVGIGACPRRRRGSRSRRSSSRSNTLRPMPATTMRRNRSRLPGGQPQRRDRAERERRPRRPARPAAPRRSAPSGRAYAAGSCGFGASPWPSRSTPITGRPASASSSVNPLRRHVASNDPPHPWTSTTGRGVGSGHGRSVDARPALVTLTGRDSRHEDSPMRLLHPDPGHDLTYNDVFMVPSLSAVRLAPRRRPHHARRHRHAPARRRRQHDRRRRAADGRDGRPPRRHHGAAAGHPARRRRLGHRVRQVVPPGLRDADHAVAAPHDRRRPRAGPQAGPRRRRRRRRRQPAARRVHRARRRRLRPLHPAARRDEPRAGHRARRHRRPRRPSTCWRRTAARWRPSSTATAGSSASSPARARCARRPTARRSTPTAG